MISLSSAFRCGPRDAHRHAACSLFAAVVAAAAAAAADVTPRMLLLDGAVVGSDIIAVGERGSILRSPDNARTWHPSASPVHAALTGISFATSAAPRFGWAVGHDAVILATTDTGRTWVKQYQGENLQDSFLDVLALDAQRVIAVGAYGLFVITTDGGKTWTRQKITDEDFHFNRITRGPSGTLYIAGEHGTLLRSTDQGAQWSPLTKPYDGSFYGVVALDQRTLVAYGLRGHAYRSIDDGVSWQPLPTKEPTLLATAVKLRDNTLVFAGQAHTLLVSRDEGRTADVSAASPAGGIAKLIELPDGALLALGEAGADVIDRARITPAAGALGQRAPAER